MKRLKVVGPLDQVEGLVIEFFDGKYGTRRYFRNDLNGEYQVEDEFEDEISTREVADIACQKNLIKRIRKLHNYFRRAEYINFNVIDNFNVNEEDVEEVLPQVCDMSLM